AARRARASGHLQRGAPMTDDPTEPDSPGGSTGEDAHRLHLVGEEGYANWDEIYMDNVVRVYRLLYSKVGNRQDAEDLTTEVFLAALGPLRTSASRPEVRSYLARTAQTVLASFWRQRLGREVTRIDLDAARDFLQDPPSESDGRSRARDLLRALPDRYRTVLELRFLEGKSVRDAADAMGVTV